MKALLAFVLLLAAPTGAAPDRARVVPLWNEFTLKTKAETQADLRLQDSYKEFNPYYLAGPYAPRRELLDSAIRLSEERTRLLRKMREAEFGPSEATR